MATDKYPYKVYDADGSLMLQATEPEDKETALSIMEHGYTIKFNGKKLTKKEVKVSCKNSV